jgi:hypothetical protein
MLRSAYAHGDRLYVGAGRTTSLPFDSRRGTRICR